MSSAGLTSSRPLSLGDAGRPPPIFLRSERRVPPDGPLDAPWRWLQAQVVPHLARRRVRGLARILPHVAAQNSACAAASEAELDRMLAEAAPALRRSNRFENKAVARVFAIVRELSGRVIGQRHYDVQILGAYAMLSGMLAEMATGEGKTLTATLTAGTAALAGFPVHVITVNDYLAARDAEHLRPLYERMGLSVGVVLSGQSTAERQRAYACDIVYGTNKELAFDYLRDTIALGEHHDNLRLKLERLHSAAPRAASLRMRGLHFAIVDEADSVLVDEARTPLIISAPAKTDIYEQTAGEAIALARRLDEPRHYSLAESEQRVLLTFEGQKAIERLSQPLSLPWRSQIVRDELASQALAALHLYKRDEHYLVRDGKVAIIDQYTGRIMPDRMWSSGLHQMIETKEGCAISHNRETIARITYQKLFRRYAVLSGMSGTLRPIAAELWSVYRIVVAAIPTHRPLRRVVCADMVFDTEAEKWAAVIARVSELAQKRIPVLVGTRSVAASEHLSGLFDAIGLEHAVLNASQDKREAEIVAEAGQLGRVTIATNMAGRGTDIKLAEEALALGGLHVIMTERHDARRIDDQLAGRSARQGEPGHFEAFLSLEDPLMTMFQPPWPQRLLASVVASLKGDRRVLLLSQQRRIERQHRRMRTDLLRTDRSERQLNALTGQGE
jgi:preprotein translocase subunit SecA